MAFSVGGVHAVPEGSAFRGFCCLRCLAQGAQSELRNAAAALTLGTLEDPGATLRQKSRPSLLPFRVHHTFPAPQNSNLELVMGNFLKS